MQLLPYVNYEYNILCENPNEVEPIAIRGLGSKEQQTDR